MKKKKKKIKASRIRMLIFVPISLILIGYFFYLLISYPYNIIKLKNEEKKYEQELLKLEIDEKNLKNEIEKLKDIDYLARYARENYQYSKDGEIILKIDKKEEEKEEIPENKEFNSLLIISISFSILIAIYIFIKGRH